MAFRPPIRIASGTTPGGNTLGIIYGVDTASRAVIGSLVSLVGLEILDNNASALSVALFFGAIISLPLVLFTGGLIRVLTRKYVFSIGVILALLSNLLFMLDTPLSFTLANTTRMAGAGLVMMCISLYTMDFIPRRQLAAAESRKILFAGMAWTAFPALGTWMWVNVNVNSPFILSAALIVALLGLFWMLRISEAENIKPPDTKDINFLRNIKHYFANPHMRIAYLIAVARSSSWVVFFTYGPIYIRDAGVPPEWIGLFMGAIVSVLMLSDRFSKIAQFIGIRRTILLSFLLAGTSMIILGLLPQPTLAGLLLLLIASLGLDMLDTIGNVPFMRMVTPKVRTEMTTVFSTWREVSFAMTPGLAAIFLLMTDISGLFAILGCVLVAAGLLTRAMPIRVD